MMFTIEEFSQWLGLTQFEILIQTICLLVFTGLLTYHIDFMNGDVTSNIWWIFAPLFAANVINAYFCVIVFIRTCLERTFKSAIFRALWSSTVIGILMLFEYMLCQKLIGGNSLDTSEVVSPILLLLQLLAVRACQIQ
ncbi:transmembrane protein 203 isoform X1 [Planococcus citri]|uniref:transmembrane protein 203 isoform X1 n=1 Tax=Planococcus citri TaxID=170843 RepID=UPI0031F7D45A